MKANLKKIEIKAKVSRIIMEHDDASNNKSQRDELVALAILLGGYNKFGRDVDVDKYAVVKMRFDECISEIKNLL